MIKHLILLEDELGNRRKVKPGRVVVGPNERPVGMEATPEWEMEILKRKGMGGSFLNYKFKTCMSCKKEGVYEHT
jgi:hypothetical protein